ncbi:MAG TPA: hypothetical protein VFY14_20160 [Streptomyces sp.]|nr:hypothetical protein [Streptomyces sp.]
MRTARKPFGGRASAVASAAIPLALVADWAEGDGGGGTRPRPSTAPRAGSGS